ncbi:MAG: hypothetical protein KW802_00565 [Candidatus Doudnabacteria bacterium]|nr:hypothetical protein [Candidatus Doudnabacteria bacterium]
MADEATYKIEWRKHMNTFAERLFEVLAGGFGAFLYHFLSEKKDKDNKVVLDKDGKPVMTLDSDKIRAHAPYFVLGLSDEAEFNALVSHLDPASQKNLEIQMGPIPFGPFTPGQVPPGLGDHQRSDVILTTVQINLRDKPPLPDGTNPRQETMNMLQQLADIADPAEWKRRAVAFKLMKAKENDYIGALITKEASTAIISAIADFRQAYADASAWAQEFAEGLDDETDRILAGLRRRESYGFFRGFFSAISRSLALPWETKESSRPMANDDRLNGNTDANRRDASHDCGSNNPRRSKLGFNFCFRGVKIHFDGLMLDAGFYRQRAKREDNDSDNTNS